jgi:pilus assembly protein CpaE
MRESKRIFLVCTPEINALHLARRKYRFLQTQDLGDRVSLLVNRVDNHSGMSADEIQEMVGLAPMMMLPNNYVEVQRALSAGTHVDSAFAFGRQCSELAHRLLERNYQPPRVGSGVAAYISTRLFQRFIHLRSNG